MKNGWTTPPGYPKTFTEKVLAGALDEVNRRGSRTRLLKLEPGAFSTVPLRFDVITLFPELFGPHQTQGITRRAYEGGGLFSFLGHFYLDLLKLRLPAWGLVLGPWLLFQIVRQASRPARRLSGRLPARPRGQRTGN